MRRFVWLLVLVSAMLAVACSPSPSGNEGGPGATVRQFFEHLNDGEYTEAMGLYNSEALDVFEDDSTGATFGGWAASETKNGTLDEVKILSEAVEQRTANVEFELVYGDGSTKQGRTKLTLEDDEWKMGLVY